jgi:hypothetical protein
LEVLLRLIPEMRKGNLLSLVDRLIETPPKPLQ